MTDIENPAGKVAGYTAQPDAKVDPAPGTTWSREEEAQRLTTLLDAAEAQLLDDIDNMEIRSYVRDDGVVLVSRPDGRWKSIGKTHIEQGFMALRRSVQK